MPAANALTAEFIILWAVYIVDWHIVIIKEAGFGSIAFFLFDVIDAVKLA